jgi:hypothetical protein
MELATWAVTLDNCTAKPCDQPALSQHPEKIIRQADAVSVSSKHMHITDLRRNTNLRTKREK